MVYLLETTALPQEFLDYDSFNVRRSSGKTSIMSVDPRGSVHLQASKIFVDMHDGHNLNKTVCLDAKFVGDNEGLHEGIAETHLIVPEKVDTSVRDAWDRAWSTVTEIVAEVKN